MYINCYYKTEEMVMAPILENYISQTPFLRVWEKCGTPNYRKENFLSKVDLVIMEISYFSKASYRKMELTLKNKPLLILTDCNAVKDENLQSNIIFLPKNLSRKEFIEGVSALIDKLEK